MADLIRVGLAGYGLAGAMLHAPVIAGLPEFRITGVMTSRPEAVQLASGPVVVPDLEALLGLDCDLIVIVTPNPLHAVQAEAALRAGRHVLIDKPMAIDVAACDRLIDLAAGTGRVLSVYHNRRFDGDFLAAKRVVAEKVVGAPMLMEANWDRFRPVPPATWRNADGAGAGLFWDLGPHMIDQAIALFGWPDRMQADVAVQREGARADDWFTVTLGWGVRRALLSASSFGAAARPRFALHGAHGSWWSEGLDPVEAALRAGHDPAAPGFPERLPPISAWRAGREGERIAQPVAAGDPFGFYRGLAAAIRGEGPSPMDPVRARDVVALIAAAHECVARASTGSVSAAMPHPRLPLAGYAV
jgi:scyllo-inositol 2-dehydrogenase (NADP+)